MQYLLNQYHCGRNSPDDSYRTSILRSTMLDYTVTSKTQSLKVSRCITTKGQQGALLLLVFLWPRSHQLLVSSTLLVVMRSRIKLWRVLQLDTSVRK